MSQLVTSPVPISVAWLQSWRADAETGCGRGRRGTRTRAHGASGARGAQVPGTGLRVAVGPGPVIPLLTLCFFSGLHRPNPALIRCLPAHQRLWGSSQEVRISGPRSILENRSLVSRVHLLQKAALTVAPECHPSLSHSPWSLMTRGIASCRVNT